MRQWVGTVGRMAAAGASVLVVTACAPGASTSAATGGAPARADDSATSSGHADCTRASKTVLDGDGFHPAKVTLQRGAFLAVTNQGNDAARLTAEPAAKLVGTVVDPQERQIVQFPAAGTFTVKSKSGAALRVTVAGESGCGAPKPTIVITGAGKFAPADVQVAATANFLVVNHSAADHTLTCDPDGIGDHNRVDPGETAILALDDPGRYTCHSVQHPSAKVVITVTG